MTYLLSYASGLQHQNIYKNFKESHMKNVCTFPRTFDRNEGTGCLQHIDMNKEKQSAASSMDIACAVFQNYLTNIGYLLNKPVQFAGMPVEVERSNETNDNNTSPRKTTHCFLFLNEIGIDKVSLSILLYCFKMCYLYNMIRVFLGTEVKMISDLVNPLAGKELTVSIGEVGYLAL